jgi:hypothetical protein
MVQIQTMSLAELCARCHPVGLDRLIRYLTYESGTLFFFKLENARVCWTYAGWPTRHGYRLRDGGTAGDGGEPFSGLITVEPEDARAALHQGQIRISYVREVKSPAPDALALEEDLRLIPPPDPNARFRRIVVESLRTGDASPAVLEPDGAGPKAVDLTPGAVDWPITPATILVDRATATSALRTLCGAEEVETEAWAADARDAAAFRAIPEAERSKRTATLAAKAEQQKDKVIGALILTLASNTSRSLYRANDHASINQIAKKLTELMTSRHVPLVGLKDRNLRELLRNGLKAVNEGDQLGDDDSPPDM